MFGLHLLGKGPHDVIYPVTITNNARVGWRRDIAVAALSLNLRSVSTKMQFVGLEDVSKEDSARGRIAQSILAGSAFAIACSVAQLYVTENGMGAISLPMTADQFGSTATKATHPHTLALFGELVGLATGRAFEIVNLGLHCTKGEMINALATDLSCRAALGETSTCDRRKRRGLLRGCGVCTSCVLRYAAFRAAGVVDSILYDVEPSFTPSAANRAGMAVEFQAQSLAAIIKSDNPILALESSYPGIRKVLPYFPTGGELISPVARYITETLVLADGPIRSRHAA